MRAVIVAGGKGTRLGALAADRPKALAPLLGRPVLDYTLDLLRRHGARDVTICTGHLAGQIENHARDGSAWGLRIRYSRETTPLGTAGSLRAIQPPPAEDFLVIYGDILIEADLTALMEAHRRHHAAGTLLVHPNDHPYDSDLVELDWATRRVRAIHKKPHPPAPLRANLVNASCYALSPGILELIDPMEKADCAHDLFPRALERGLPVYAHRTGDYLKDIGSPERINEAERDLCSGRLDRLKNRAERRAVFIDRDGVICRDVGRLCHPDQLDLLPGSASAIRRLNHAGWLTFVVTHPADAERGPSREEVVQAINAKFEALLGLERAYVDAICDGRGDLFAMIDEDRAEFRIDIAGSFLVGDATTDILTAARAGARTLVVRTGHDGCDGKHVVDAAQTADDLASAVDWILTHDQ